MFGERERGRERERERERERQSVCVSDQGLFQQFCTQVVSEVGFSYCMPKHKMALVQFMDHILMATDNLPHAWVYRIGYCAKSIGSSGV